MQPGVDEQDNEHTRNGDAAMPTKPLTHDKSIPVAARVSRDVHEGKAQLGAADDSGAPHDSQADELQNPNLR